MSGDRTGVVVIRVWLEGGDARHGLRARISLVPNVERGETESVAAASSDEIVETVRAFVDRFTGKAAAPAGQRGDAPVTERHETPEQQRRRP